ncbi:MAG: helix-turn-helix domain-containing protein [Puniceicoccaceae bacterium]
MDNLNQAFRRRKAPARIEVPEGQVRVLESHHDVDFQMPVSTWSFHKICWVAVGKGELESEEGRYSLRADDILLLPADWPHRFVDDPREPLTLVILCISGKFMEATDGGGKPSLWESIRESTAPGKPLRARTAFHRSNLIEMFRLALQEQGRQRRGWETILETIASRVLVSFARGHLEEGEVDGNSSLRSVEGAIEYIDTHVHERLTIEEMASRSNLSPRRFTTLFKQLTGETFSNYLNQKRIEYACQRLDETGHILYACHGSGFNDVAYFYRVFKKFTGMTPGEYLKKA